MVIQVNRTLVTIPRDDTQGIHRVYTLGTVLPWVPLGYNLGRMSELGGTRMIVTVLGCSQVSLRLQIPGERG